MLANSEAEYTEAPASLTIIFCIGRSGYIFIRSRINLSVSREPVPLPILTNLTSYLAINLDSYHSFCGDNGKIVTKSSTWPVLSITAAFTPVLIPGSKPKIICPPAGAANNRSRKLLANILIASKSAYSRN